jgi:hypothetical protein
MTLGLLAGHIGSNMLPGGKAKSGILLALWKSINAKEAGCSGVASLAWVKALDSFGKRIGERSTLRRTVHELSLSFMAGYRCVRHSLVKI